MQYSDPPFFRPNHAPLPRMAPTALPTPWEPYRPRRLPLPSKSQAAAVGLFVTVALVAMI